MKTEAFRYSHPKNTIGLVRYILGSIRLFLSIILKLKNKICKTCKNAKEADIWHNRKSSRSKLLKLIPS